jgi:hypothetical protein
MLDSLSSDVTDIMFHVHLSKGALKSCQSILHAVMVPSLLSSSLSWARSCPCSSTSTTFEGDGALHQSTSRDQRHDKKQALAQSKIPPDQWQRLAGRGVRPC